MVSSKRRIAFAKKVSLENIVAFFYNASIIKMEQKMKENDKKSKFKELMTQRVNLTPETKTRIKKWIERIVIAILVIFVLMRLGG